MILARAAVAKIAISGRAGIITSNSNTTRQKCRRGWRESSRDLEFIVTIVGNATKMRHHRPFIGLILLDNAAGRTLEMYLFRLQRNSGRAPSSPLPASGERESKRAFRSER